MNPFQQVLAWLIVPIRFFFWPIFLIYRGYLHPLSRFPGPKWASMTKWYEFYFDVVCKGQFTFQIQELHKKYGPIVRITPDELHIQDSSFYDQLYSSTAIRDKDVWMAPRFGAPKALPVTASHALHATRRSAIEPLFSSRSIQDLEPKIRELTDLLCSKIAGYAESGEILPLQLAWSAYAGDVVSEVVLGHSYKWLESRGFEGALDDALKAAGQAGPMVLQFPWIMTLLNALPDYMVGTMEPRMKKLLALQADSKRRSAEALKRRPPKSSPNTIFQQLLSSDLSPQELTPDRIWQETQTAIGFGIPAPTWALTVTSYHLIANPAIRDRLHAELVSAMPDPSPQQQQPPLSAAQLMQLPCLHACIQEGLRLSYGTSTRLPRIDPQAQMVYQEWVIPAGTAVSMTNVDLHHDEALFPDSHRFEPERWLGMGKEELGRYMVAFGGGSRKCVGLHLANAELYMGVASVFRRFRFEFFETDDSDVVLKHDYFSPMPKLDSKGVRVRVVAVE